jgi:hypothetical protein
MVLLSQIQDSPSLEGQFPIFISPRNRVAQLYPQALNSLFVASNDSQGYGGGTCVQQFFYCRRGNVFTEQPSSNERTDTFYRAVA